MSKIVIKKSTFGENTYRPFVASTKQIVQIEQGNSGTTLDEVLKNIRESQIDFDNLTPEQAIARLQPSGKANRRCSMIIKNITV